MRFKDRTDAGRRLAEKLATTYAGQNGIVYALPRGGIVPGAEIARRLRMPLDLIIAQKIGHPGGPECTVGAVTETGDPVIDRLGAASVQDEWLHRHIVAARQEARRRRGRYVGGRMPLSATGKLAIVVDDGIATRLAMEAAIRELQAQRPARLVVAIPVAPAEAVRQLMNDVDEVVALNIAEGYGGAVGAYYEYFPRMSDEEVVALLGAAASARQDNLA